MTIFATILSSSSPLMSVLLLIKTKNPLGWIVLPLKLAPGALSPIWAIIGLVGALLGWAYDALWAVPIGILGAGMLIGYVWRCTRGHEGFELSFGVGWSAQIPPQQARHIVQNRSRSFLR